MTLQAHTLVYLCIEKEQALALPLLLILVAASVKWTSLTVKSNLECRASSAT